MSKIAISELCPAGTQFFSESETFLDNLTDDDLTSVIGGSVRGAYYGDTHEKLFPLEKSVFCSPNFSTYFGHFPP
jgi:hypothetical protein